jgi:penicillin-binding protein 1B
MTREPPSNSDSKPAKRPGSRTKSVQTKRANPTKKTKGAKPSSGQKGKTLFRHILSLLVQLGLLFSVIATAATALYLANLTEGIDKRFAGRLWNIPSKIYSDITLIYPGQTINHSHFLAKLSRLGYREVPGPPAIPGEMRVSKTSLEIYLHEFSAPFYEQKSLPVWIGLNDSRVTAITRKGFDTKGALLELEPEVLMLYFGPDRERRQLISIGQLPKHVLQAVLSAEDHGFYHHSGVEIRAILRALLNNLIKWEFNQGGSTITQQLAKNYFLTPERTLSRKFKELLITCILEYKFDKDTILEMYLNEIYFGREGSVSINGIGEAARFFFDKSASDLSVSEAAVLAGLIKAPNQLSPHRNRERCTSRRNDVLDAMQKNGWLTAESLQHEKARPIKPAAYRGYRQQAPYFMDYLTHQLTTLYSRETLSSEGLSIFTTIDTQVQIAAETALQRGLERLESANPALKRKDPEESLQGAIIVMQPKTGYILAMVGGRDYGVSQFNRAAQAKRQPGSAFKPFVYLAALDKHTPLSPLSNSPRTFMVNGRPWTPKNFSAQAEPVVTLRTALAQSQNLATVNLAYNIGLARVTKIARAFHFSTPDDPYPSMALGTLEVEPLSLARAYCAFASDGVLPFPLSIKEVVNTTGKTIESHHVEIERLTTPAKAYMMSDLMRDVVRDGTARSLKQLGVNWPVAGKTGTTNDSRDAWFVGYTPNLLALVWVGFDSADAVNATGARAALPIWADLMASLPQYVSGEWLPTPPGIEKLKICVESGEMANADCCPRVVEEIFLSENRPTATCRQHECASQLEKIWNGIKKIVPNF